MGLFDDFTNFMGEVQSLKNEVTQLGTDVVKEIVSEANGVKETVADTASEIKSTTNDVGATFKQSVSLSDDATIATDKTAQLEDQ